MQTGKIGAKKDEFVSLGVLKISYYIPLQHIICAYFPTLNRSDWHFPTAVRSEHPSQRGDNDSCEEHRGHKSILRSAAPVPPILHSEVSVDETGECFKESRTLKCHSRSNILVWIWPAVDGLSLRSGALLRGLIQSANPSLLTFSIVSFGRTGEEEDTWGGGLLDSGHLADKAVSTGWNMFLDFYLPLPHSLTFSCPPLLFSLFVRRVVGLISISAGLLSPLRGRFPVIPLFIFSSHSLSGGGRTDDECFRNTTGSLICTTTKEKGWGSCLLLYTGFYKSRDLFSLAQNPKVKVDFRQLKWQIPHVYMYVFMHKLTFISVMWFIFAAGMERRSTPHPNTDSLRRRITVLMKVDCKSSLSHLF